MAGFFSGLLGQPTDQEEKISSANGLNNANGSDNNNQNGNNQQQRQETQKGTENDDEINFDNLFGSDFQDSDFQLPDDLIKPRNQNTTRGGENDDETAVGGQDDDPDVQLNNQLTELLNGIGVKLEQIPDDLDLTDKKQLQGFMTKIQKSTAQSAIALVAPIMQRAVDNLRTEFQEMMQSTMTQNKVQQTVRQAFQPFVDSLQGESNKGRLKFAQQQFQLALGQLKDPSKAALATSQMLKSMFDVNINVKRRNPSNNRNGNDEAFDLGTTFKEGDDALNSLFK